MGAKTNSVDARELRETNINLRNIPPRIGLLDSRSAGRPSRGFSANRSAPQTHSRGDISVATLVTLHSAAPSTPDPVSQTSPGKAAAPPARSGALPNPSRPRATQPTRPVLEITRLAGFARSFGGHSPSGLRGRSPGDATPTGGRWSAWSPGWTSAGRIAGSSSERGMARGWPVP